MASDIIKVVYMISIINIDSESLALFEKVVYIDRSHKLRVEVVCY